MNSDLISREALKNLLLDSRPDDLQQSDINFLAGDIKVSLKFVLNIIDNAPAVYDNPYSDGREDGYIEGYEEAKRECDRPKGEWKHLQAIGDYKCSICGCENLYKYANEHERWVKTNSNFCPNCGADMRKGGAV